jgi:GNAT superfamily N-acetyltransferase
MPGEPARAHNGGFRAVTAADNPGLRELERSCPQGRRLKIYSERDDYFLRSRLYGNDYTLVAEDRQQGRLIGVMAAALKEVYLGGAVRPAAFFYDLRVHPDYRRSVLGRHMLEVWNDMERWAQESGAHLIYGLVKHDNEPMIGMRDKRSGYRFVGSMQVVSRPVYRRKRVRELPEEVRPEDAELSRAVWRRYGSRDFYPAAFRHELLTPAMAATGLFSFHRLRRGGSWAALGLFRAARVQRTRVVRIPSGYKLLRPLFSALRPLLPLPRIPVEGGSIGYYCIFNSLAEGPQGPALWRELVAHANNLALEEGAALLTGAFDPGDPPGAGRGGDPFLVEFRRGALNCIDYLLGVRALAPDLPDRPRGYFPDVRDMN